jgi:Zn-finger nucleic acid-binding protein
LSESRCAVLNCPRDLSQLISHRTRRLLVQRCERCGGLWLPSGTMALAMRHAALHVRTDSCLSSLACPEDGNRLTTIKSRGIEIDVCMACNGVWLDQGELNRILVRKRVGEAATTSLDIASCVQEIPVEGVFEMGGAAVEAVIEVVAGILTAWSAVSCQIRIRTPDLAPFRQAGCRRYAVAPPITTTAAATSLR